MKRNVLHLACLALAGTLALATAASAQLIGGHIETAEPFPVIWAVGPVTPTPGAILGGGAASHILITEVVVTPTGAEFVEICNPTTVMINLNDTYLSDDWFDGPPKSGYFRVVLGAGYVIPVNTDFNVRFPATAVILPGQRLVIAVDGAAFMAAFGGLVPNFEINPTSPVVPDMIDVGNNAPRSTALLTNTSECVVLYHWDGQSDNVCDNDYITWGPLTTSNRVDKTGVSIDGPDGDALPSPFLPDTPGGAQAFMPAPAAGSSIERLRCDEVAEPTPGNGCVVGATPTTRETWGKLKVRYR